MLALPAVPALPAPEHGRLLWLEVTLWLVPAALAARRWGRSERGRRAVWLVVAAACAVIVADKLVDLQSVVHHAGQELFRRLDPEHRLRGPHLWIRVALLSGLFVAGCLALVALARADRERSAAKALALAGLVAVMAYLGARLVPALRDPLGPPTGWGIEGLCWLAVVAGVARGAPGRRDPPAPGRRGVEGGGTGGGSGLRDG